MDVMKFKIDSSFLVDVAFECYDENVCKSLGRSIFQEQKVLQIDTQISAHTFSGYFFIMEKNAMVCSFSFIIKPT